MQVTMPEVWVWLTVSAALIQAIRTAGQKELTAKLSVLAGTFVRSVLGFPVMLLYLAVVWLWTGEALPPLNVRFLIYALITAITQIAATMALLMLYRLRSFAVTNQLGKSDMVFTAILGSAFFGQALSAHAWLALAVTASGVAIIMLAKSSPPGGEAALPVEGKKTSVIRVLTSKPVGYGLLVGVMFGLCNLALREASLALAPASSVMAGAVTVAVVTFMQAIMMGTLTAQREPGTQDAILRAFPLAMFVGVTSAVGSILWFTAFAMTTAAHVRIVGQVEVIFTLLISAFYFRERITRMEGIGIAVTIAGIILLQMTQ